MPGMITIGEEPPGPQRKAEPSREHLVMQRIVEANPGEWVSCDFGTPNKAVSAYCYMKRHEYETCTRNKTVVYARKQPRHDIVGDLLRHADG